MEADRTLVSEEELGSGQDISAVLASEEEFRNGQDISIVLAQKRSLEADRTYLPY